MLKDAKYCIAYLAPAAAFAGIYAGGIWSLGSFYLSFLLIPILEHFIPYSTENLKIAEEQQKGKSFFFDLLLYLNLPILYLLIWYYLTMITSGNLAGYEVVFMTLNVGIIVSTLGINVAHELGHRPEWYNQFCSKALLLSALYMHFNIEHNRGHHKNVATEKDPASARLGENLYAFWWRSVSGSYLNAWRLENKRLLSSDQSILGWTNEMIRFQLIQILYLVVIALYFGATAVVGAVLIAIIGFLLLETVNYIEHYGLRRKLLAPGKYEKVLPIHSWNSDHELGRIFLYELTRHSDHHYKASRKYQILRHFNESPQLPYGYPGSMILSLFPPLWFKLMDEKVLALQY